MKTESQATQLSALETIFVLGIVGCLLLATWELGHLMVDDWFEWWVAIDPYVRKRIILYGIAFFMSITSILVTTLVAFRVGRFGQALSRAFLSYGILLLISTIVVFIFDCLPEVFAGFIGAAIFACALYVLHKKYYTKERIMKYRVEKGRCYSCGSNLPLHALYCPACGTQVGKKCPTCDGFVKIVDKFCPTCGIRLQEQ